MTTIRFLRSIAVCFLAFSSTAKSQETSAPYTLVNGRIEIPGWDKRPKPEDLLRSTVTTEVFPAEKPYLNSVLVRDKPLVSRDFTVPGDVTEVVIVGRSIQTEQVFPRIRISLQTGESKHLIFEGIWASLGIMRRKVALPVELRGKVSRLHLEILNPATGDDPRTFYFGAVEFLGESLAG